MRRKSIFQYVFSLMCQIVTLSSKITVQNVRCVFNYFCARHKNKSAYNFGAPLTNFKIVRFYCNIQFPAVFTFSFQRETKKKTIKF